MYISCFEEMSRIISDPRAIPFIYVRNEAFLSVIYSKAIPFIYVRNDAFRSVIYTCWDTSSRAVVLDSQGQAIGINII